MQLVLLLVNSFLKLFHAVGIVIGQALDKVF